MPIITPTAKLQTQMNNAMTICTRYRHEFVTPEHLLRAFIDDADFSFAFDFYATVDELRAMVDGVLQSDRMETVPADRPYSPETSAQTDELLTKAAVQAKSSDVKQVDTPHVVQALFALDESWAAYCLHKLLNGQEVEFLFTLIFHYDLSAHADAMVDNLGLNSLPYEGEDDDDDEYDDEEEEDDDDDDDFDLDDDEMDDELEDFFAKLTQAAPTATESKPRQQPWRKLVTCMNDVVASKNPLIGREQELERTIQVLCRRDKNNPLHVGEPGVGKTALVYGLVARIVAGKVPRRLKGAHVYQLDLGTLLAGAQYRGDLERRIKMIMEGIVADGPNNIVYIDEIHNLVGAGAGSEGSMDASNQLKPYLEDGTVRFIGSTTYDEYNRHFSRSKGLVRRFQQIDILEPTVDECIGILRQLAPHYEQFHGVSYDADALEYAVKASAKYVNDRFLPDKAIDLIDEAGAALEAERGTHRPRNRQQQGARVTLQRVADVLSKTCKVDAMAMGDEERQTQQLETLEQQLLGQVYGQDEAVRQVVMAVQTAKAGLTDDDKPLASLLFVGPTGVGKTEVARQLARQMGMELVRFDMSEYAEKHTVAKLIGSPAGYVGYEDGGLLTDAIRRTPNCVLLLDELEKAHTDIYNILLQVMDYARLTDNKGRKADFRNVVIIMTSNAGAQYAGQASIGFQGGVSRGDAMMRTVKKTFKPEFINRLSGTVVFNDMDRTMAARILRKKLDALQQRLDGRHVRLTLGDDAFDRLLDEGFSREYGAREMDRVISHRLKPLLTHDILFGPLRDGGRARVTLKQGELALQSTPAKKRTAKSAQKGRPTAK